MITFSKNDHFLGKVAIDFDEYMVEI